MNCNEGLYTIHLMMVIIQTVAMVFTVFLLYKYVDFAIRTIIKLIEDIKQL